MLPYISNEINETKVEIPFKELFKETVNLKKKRIHIC
jgi:hypothetical protein